MTTESSRVVVKHDLKKLLAGLLKSQPAVDEIYLFGSRAYNTGSLRSDCDLLVRVSPTRNAKPGEFRDFSQDVCPALDFFLCSDAKAISCLNDSFVFASTFTELVKKLDAVKLWTRDSGFTNFAFGETGTWEFSTAAGVEFVPTGLSDAYVRTRSWHQIAAAAEAVGLPANPFIGETLPKAISTIISVARKMIFSLGDLGQRGIAKNGWTVNLPSEYECQNLFFTVVKPWLSGLAREQVAVKYDGQEKLSDFSLFDGQLIVEMKFIDADKKKAEVVKTLDGLSRFYSQNPNVRCLLFIIYVKQSVRIDAPKWEADYTFQATTPHVITIVIRIP